MDDALLEAEILSVVQKLRALAETGDFNGMESGFPYVQRCTLLNPATRTQLIFTRDTGHHTSGWFKNPEYERCYHLSLAPMQGQGLIVTRVRVIAELDRKTRDKWVRAFFGDDSRYLWVESAKTRMGQAARVTHWRMFCDEHWRPIVPKGEVYSPELTERGWRSASQVLDEDGIRIQSPLNP